MSTKSGQLQYQGHQGATLVDTYLEMEPVGPEASRVPDLTESASIGPDGSLTVTLANLTHDGARSVEAIVVGQETGAITAPMLHGTPEAHNTFEAPAAVLPVPFEAHKRTDRGFTAELPAACVVVFTIGGTA